MIICNKYFKYTNRNNTLGLSITLFHVKTMETTLEILFYYLFDCILTASIILGVLLMQSIQMQQNFESEIRIYVMLVISSRGNKWFI